MATLPLRLMRVLQLTRSRALRRPRQSIQHLHHLRGVSATGGSPRTGRLTVASIGLMATLLITIGGLSGTAKAAGGNYAWPPSTCSSPLSETAIENGTSFGFRCIAGAQLASRGKIAPSCLGGPPTPFEVYTSRNPCGGGQPAIEKIAQARTINELNELAGGSSTGQINPAVQWEVRNVDTSETQRTTSGQGWADETYADPSAPLDPNSDVQVYENKLTTNSDYGSVDTQVRSYVNGLSSAGMASVSPGTALSGWYDVFFAPTGTSCPGQPGTTQYEVFLSWPHRTEVNGEWSIDDGVISTWGYVPPCFDPYTEDPDPPDDSDNPPAELPSYSSWPVESALPKPGPAEPTDALPSPTAAPSTPPVPSGATATGDTHITTLNGEHYDFQAEGEFTFAEGDDGVEVQARVEPWNSSEDVSSVTDVAFTLGGHVIEITTPESGDESVLIDSTPYTLAAGDQLTFPDGSILENDAGTYYVEWPQPEDGGTPLELWTGPGTLSMQAPPSVQLYGLLGTSPTDPGSLLSGNDVELPVTADASTIDGSYADSWRIGDEISLFTYTAGDDTETYTDRDFPYDVVTLSDLSAAAYADGSTACNEADVLPGPQFDDCVIDWAETNADSFVANDAADTQAVTEPGAVSVDASGNLTEDFSGSIPTNFAAATYGTGAGEGTFAGPFTTTQEYAYYVPALPAHDAATITMDVIAFGDWSPDVYANTLNVDVNGVTAYSQSLDNGDPISSGTTSTGEAYAVYPVQFTVTDSSPQLDVGVTATLPVGGDQAFGVSQIAVSASLTPPQSFVVSLPASVSSGSPTSGAGDLETVSSEDDYMFTAPSSGGLIADFSNCSDGSDGLSWTLTDLTTSAVVQSGSGYNDCTDYVVKGLSAGDDYEMSVTHPGASITYALDMQMVPPPDSFGVTLPASISSGVPGTGAGNLETTASEDDYSFTASASGSLILDLSNCSDYSWAAVWTVVDTTTGATVGSGGGINGCADNTVAGISNGDSYTVAVTPDFGNVSTYDLALQMVPAPDRFHVTLPASVSPGVPGAGAGNLETTASEDDYSFTASASGSLILNLSNCSDSSWAANWTVVDTTTGATVGSGGGINGCADNAVGGITNGDSYTVALTPDYGNVTTYDLALQMVPGPDKFNVTLPASVSPGVPGAGAGNLETTASEDDYSFSATASGSLILNLSNCSDSSWAANWTVVDTTTGTTVGSGGGINGCADNTVAGITNGDSYTVALTTDYGNTTTYDLALQMVPGPDSFDVTLPASISPGVPGPGAGTLETTASEDDYSFTASASGSLILNLSNCSDSTWAANWTVVDTTTGATVGSGGGINGCADNTLAGITNGDSYTVALTTDYGNTTTYSLYLALSGDDGNTIASSKASRHLMAASVFAATPNAVARGSQGDVLTISGQGFARASRVGVAGHGVFAKVLRWSKTSLTVRVRVTKTAELGARRLTIRSPAARVCTRAAGLIITRRVPATLKRMKAHRPAGRPRRGRTAPGGVQSVRAASARTSRRHGEDAPWSL